MTSYDLFMLFLFCLFSVFPSCLLFVLYFHLSASKSIFVRLSLSLTLSSAAVLFHCSLTLELDIPPFMIPLFFAKSFKNLSFYSFHHHSLPYVIWQPPHTHRPAFTSLSSAHTVNLLISSPLLSHCLVSYSLHSHPFHPSLSPPFPSFLPFITSIFSQESERPGREGSV